SSNTFVSNYELSESKLRGQDEGNERGPQGTLLQDHVCYAVSTKYFHLIQILRNNHTPLLELMLLELMPLQHHVPF
ncbi:hypothetical protein J6590_105890, partial [Homalodisca vitripennis]